MYPLRLFGDPVLKQRARDVEEIDGDLVTLVHGMYDTMDLEEGVGLAAPQVGVAIRLAVIDVSHDPDCITFLRVDGKDAPLASIMPLKFINPELEFIAPKERDAEGCLSIQDIRAEVNRPAAVKATLPQLDGTTLVIETDGLLARAIQHETDHLNGVLFIDRVSPAMKISLRRKLKRLAEEE
jgi:peptide deformylase